MPPAAITAGFPVSTSGAEARMLQQSQQESAQKSVKFEKERSEKLAASSSRKKKHHMSSSPSSMGDQHMQSSSHKDAQSPSEMQDEYDDEDDEDEEEDADDSEEQSVNSEDEAKENEELQHKLDRIKQNLKDNTSLQQQNFIDNNSYQNRDRTMQNLNEVLQRQRDRLENLYQQQPIVYDPAEGFQDSRNSPQSKQMNTQGSANLEKAYEDLEREIRDIKNKLQRSMGGAGA